MLWLKQRFICSDRILTFRIRSRFNLRGDGDLRRHLARHFEGIKELSSLQNASIRPLARHKRKYLALGAAIIMNRCSLHNRRSLKVSFITL